MSDDELDEGPGPIPSSSHAYFDGEVVDVEHTVSGLLASLRLEEVRHRRTSDEDDEQLRIIHQKIHAVVLQDQDDARRRRLRRALPPSNCVREQIFYLRRLPQNSVPAPSYYPRLFSALDCIVKESFDEEYRKVAIILGLVESLAELLVLELNVFEFPPRNEHRSLRKLIANALTNLTYGHAISKRRLCFYSEFIPTVVRILSEAKNLTQVYAGLIRNLSWMADGRMSDVLSPTAKALARAAVVAHNERDEGCVRAILSALWNLASHSERNKRAICEEPGFLALLTSLLSNDARMTAVVESASGILKYISQYLSTNSSHMSARPELAAQLVQLLSSASFTIVANTLGALANLIAKDPHLQTLVRHDAMGMNQLNVLRNSAREDIRVAVKAVLNHLNQPVGYTRYGDMSSSMGCESMCSPRDSRLLTLRGVRMSPGAGTGFATQLSPFSVEHRTSSLPRHFARGGFSSSNHMPPHSYSGRAPLTSGPAFGFAPPPGQYQGSFIDEEVSSQPVVVPNEVTGDPDLEDSVRCTRSVSVASLGSELPNTSVGWQSCLDTASNSNRMSPVSPSELPDSPTQCAKMVIPKGDTSTPLSISVRGGSGAASSSEPRSGLTASDTTTAIVDDQPTPTFAAFVMLNQQAPPVAPSSPKHGGHSPSSSVFDVYAGVNCVDGDDLLTRSIEAVLPQPTPSSATPKQQRRMVDDRLLADMIESAQPSARKAYHGCADAHISPNVDADRLLNACIDAAMPQPSPSYKGSSKNEKGGRGIFPVTHCVRPSPPAAGHLASVEDFKSSIERIFAPAHSHDDGNSPSGESSESPARLLVLAFHGGLQVWVDGIPPREITLLSQLPHRLVQVYRTVYLTSMAFKLLVWSDDDAGSMEQPDITLPLDCFVDEDITIDCSAMSFPHEQPSSNSRAVLKSPKSTPPCSGARLRSGTPQRTKLPKPTTRMSLQKSSRSDAKLTPKKEAKSAVVPPYNYRKPESNSGVQVREIEKQTGKAVNPGQMLVTTV